MTTGEVIALIKALGSGGGGGGGSSVLVVNATTEDNTTVLDKTWTEIKDAFISGGAVIKYSDAYYTFLYAVSIDEHFYKIEDGSGYIYYATTPSDYPAYIE